MPEVARKNELTGQPVTVDVMCTLAEARARGFQHPNCTHSYSGFIPGVTTRPTGTENPEGYKEKQKQRALERKVRQAKRAQVLALGPEAQAEANARIRGAQTELREYVKQHGLKRQSGRESINRAT